MIRIEDNKDYIYHAEYNHHGSYNCDEYGCDSICRCYTISSIEISSVSIESISENIYRYIFNSDKRNSSLAKLLFSLGTDIDLYCINRILTLCKAYDTNKWYGEWESSYYGDEVSSIKMCDDLKDHIESELNIVFKLGTIEERIHYLLTKEYGSLLPIFKDKELCIQYISPEQIVFPQDKHLEIVESDNIYNEFTNYYTSFKFYKSDLAIYGIVKKDSNDKYRVIDGYHRLSSKLKNNLDRIKIITFK